MTNKIIDSNKKWNIAVDKKPNTRANEVNNIEEKWNTAVNKILNNKVDKTMRLNLYKINS